MGLSRWLERVGFIGASGGILASGFYQGLGVLTFRLELLSIVLVVVLVQAALSSILVTVFATVSGLLFLLKLGRDNYPSRVQTDGKDLTAIVPVNKDGESLRRSIRSLLNSNYDNLSICIVCEPDDIDSRRQAQQFAHHRQVRILVNRDTPGSKASAINYALDQTESEYIAVFDADERVHSSFIGHAVDRLREYEVVQGRTVPEPTGVIESLAYYESVLLSYVGRRLLYLFTDFRTASSRAVVMRRSVIEQLGGYDPEMLTEDFEFAYRCYQRRVAVNETLAYPSRIEAAHTLRDWWGQRKRWMTGYAQVLHHLVSDLDLLDYRSVLSVLICTGTVIGNVLMLSLLSKFLVLVLLNAEAWFLLPISTVGFVTLAVRLVDNRRVELPRPGGFWMVTPLLFPLYGLAMIKALFEYPLSWDGDWYSVSKGDNIGAH